MRVALLIVLTAGIEFYSSPVAACGAKSKRAGSCASGCGSQDSFGGSGGCGMHRAASRIDRTTYRIASKVRWQNFEQARLTARAENKLLLIHFSFGSQCDHCRKRQHSAFDDATVASLLNAGDRAIPVYVPLWAMTPEERAFAEVVGYGENCMLALVDADGNVARTESGRALSTRGIPDPEALAATLRPLVN